jgi:hypothetical protein
MSKATSFDSPESSSVPQGSDPYNDMCYNTLWDPTVYNGAIVKQKKTKWTEIPCKEK